jgi:hypothetical protein
MQFLCFNKNTARDVTEKFNARLNNLKTDIVKELTEQMDRRAVNSRLQRLNVLPEYHNWVYNKTTSSYDFVNNDKLLTELEQLSREYPTINIIQVPSVDVNKTLPEYNKISTDIQLIPETTKPVWLLMDTFSESLGEFGTFLCNTQFHYSFRHRKGLLLPVGKLSNVYTLSLDGVRVYNSWVALVNAGYFKFVKFNSLFDNLLPVGEVQGDFTDDDFSYYSEEELDHFKSA